MSLTATELPSDIVQLVSSVAQITGVRLPDFNIQQPISLKDVRRLLLQKPKTKTLDASKTKEAAALPNVKVSLKRETSRDKDIAIGRWKLISKALKERNLPVYDYQRTKEKKLLMVRWTVLSIVRCLGFFPR